MRLVRRLTVAAILTPALLLVLGGAPAWAGKGWASVTSSFGEPCKETPCGAGQFKEPTSVAVNDESGDVYVLDRGDARVEYFSSGGAFLGQFDGSSTPAASLLEPEGLAVNNDPVSPTHGEVYVADVGHDVIDEFSATGKYEGQLTGHCENLGEAAPCSGSAAKEVIPFSGFLQVAIDPTGELLVLEGDAEQVYEFDPTGTLVEHFTIQEPGERPGFAVDSTGNVYVTTGTGRVDKFEKGTGSRIGILELPREKTPATLAIIAATNQLLVDEGSNIQLFASPFEPATPFLTFPTEGLAESAGIAVNGANGEGTLYATQRAADDVDVFSAGAAEAPEVLGESASSIRRGEGQLTAVINPNNKETEYSFEYSHEESGGELAGTIETIPGESKLPPGFGAQTVSVGGIGLTPFNGSIYYRVVAKNELGEVKGAVQSYTKLPIIQGEKFSGLTSTSAELEAEINADFIEETLYLFEYAPEAAALGTPGAELLPGTTSLEGHEPIPVSAEAAPLEPGQQYSYRALAINEVTENSANANKGKPVAGPIETLTPFAFPAVTTGEAQSITRSSAALFGQVNTAGADASYYFEYISEAGYQAALAKHALNLYAEGESTVPVNLSASYSPQEVGPIAASGLLPEETYHYALVANNQFTLQSVGPDRTFKTAPKVLPGATTGGASSIGQTTATISGIVAPNGLKTVYGFEVGAEAGRYGPITGLGNTGGTEEAPVSVALVGLESGATYHYRVTATNVDGTVYGADQSFATAAVSTEITVPPSQPLLGGVPKSVFPTVKIPTAAEEEALARLAHPTRAQRLAKALRSCRKDHSQSRRAQCERAVKKKYKRASGKRSKAKK